MFKKPAPNQDFFKLEEEITAWWKQNNIFEKSIESRKDAKDYIFYDGPPFMSGMPHYAHLLSSIMKDIIPRYQTMKGKKVERVWGWDCHGLPIENKVEKELNLTGRKEIEAYGLDKFIEKCYEWNRVGIENWKWYVEKVGRWVDIENAYRTMDQDYMESVWWSFKQVYDKGLVYKGRRTSLYSTDFSTPVSDFEVSMDPDNYQDTEDIAVFVKFKLTQDSQEKLKDALGDKPIYLLAWTTTPWTLPSNFALAINPEAEYVAVEVNEEILVLAKLRMEDVLKDQEYKEVAQLTSEQLKGLSYEQLFNFLPGSGNDFKVYVSDYVTTEDGTGILHVAPAFGEADAKMGEEWGLSFTADIDDEGNMTVGEWAGTYLRDANPKIVEKLKAENKLFKDEIYVHRLPYYRGKNPLIYKTQEDYFINVQKLKDKLIESNKDINWVPEYFKEGRFRYILETAPDWSISRSRFWGTSMPLWKSEDGEEIVIGSRDELMQLVNSDSDGFMQKVVLKLDDADTREALDIENELKKRIDSKDEVIVITTNQSNLSVLRNRFLGETEQESKVKPVKPDEERAYYLFNEKPLDLHLPYIDKVTFKKNGKQFTRVPYTLDVWMDSGSMPYAQFHYPFQNKEKFEESFPGDYISEYTGQIRAWFYVLHVLSNAIFDKNAFKNVLVSGVMAGTDGRKMSKVYGNYPDPKETIIKYSGDALRLYLLGSTLMVGNDMNFNENDLKMQVREFMLPLWNTFTYLVTYANIHSWVPREELAYNQRKAEDDTHPWDHIPFDNVDNELDAWILLRLQQTIKEVTNNLDNYLIPPATRAIKALIDDTSKWYIRRSRERFAEGDIRAIETLYYVLVENSKLLAPFIPFLSEYVYRELAGTKIAPLPDSVHLTDYPVADENYIDQYQALLKEMEIVQKICDMGLTLRTTNNLKLRQPLLKLEVASQNEVLPTLSEWMREVVKSELNVKDVVDAINIEETETLKTNEDTSLNIKVGLETKIDESLMEEGTVREVIRSIQATRKKMGFQQGEKVKVEFDTQNSNLIDIIERNSDKIKDSVNAVELVNTTFETSEQLQTQKINNTTITLKILK